MAIVVLHFSSATIVGRPFPPPGLTDVQRAKQFDFPIDGVHGETHSGNTEDLTGAQKHGVRKEHVDHPVSR